MQTFLPMPSFKISASVLDNKRLGKQRVECKQILLCLGVSVGEHRPTKGWKNHPAVKMWSGFEAALCAYSIAVCREWRARGFNDSLLPQFIAVWRELTKTEVTVPRPAWLGLKVLHASHRSNLLKKEPSYYKKYDWAEPDNLPYFWPTQNIPV
jgi:hypothetical protein